jgi:hypothetical protein
MLSPPITISPPKYSRSKTLEFRYQHILNIEYFTEQQKSRIQH